MKCDDEGNLVPANFCAEPIVEGIPGMGCPDVKCEEPPTAEPPIIVDPPGMNYSSINGFFIQHFHSTD